MRVAIAGASGFVGSALSQFLQERDIEVIRLVRRKANVSDFSNPELPLVSTIRWDPDYGYIDVAALDEIGVDSIVNLAGENVHQRWNPSSQQRMVDSRINSTSLLVHTIFKLNSRPRSFISSSGISYYNNIALGSHSQLINLQSAKKSVDLHSTLLDESSPPGTGFLSKLTQDWERASLPNEADSKLRVVNLRIGIVLGPNGGVLGKLLPLFRIGLGGRWGNGGQYMSWISIPDLVESIYFAIVNSSIIGPVNAVTPNPVSNQEFAQTLGRILSRPTSFAVPAAVAKFLFGKEWVESTLLADYRIRPRVLIENGFIFRYPELEPFLRDALTDKTSN